MLKRIITTVIGLPVLIFVINLGGLSLQILLMALALIGLRELYKSVSQKDLAIHLIGYFFTILYYLTLNKIATSAWLLVEFTLFVITAQICMVLFFQKITLIDCLVTVYGFFYVSFLLSFIYLIRVHQFGHYYVWLIFTSSFGSDTCAYFTGISIGRHKLTHTPSPSKSIEGLIGGVLGGALVGLLYGAFVSNFLHVKEIHIVVISTVVSFAGAISSQFGDLAASAIKRHTGIKDFGTIFPGHGGVLDRFDSVIITAPIVYVVMVGMIWLVL